MSAPITTRRMKGFWPFVVVFVVFMVVLLLHGSFMFRAGAQSRDELLQQVKPVLDDMSHRLAAEQVKIMRLETALEEAQAQQAGRASVDLAEFAIALGADTDEKWRSAAVRFASNSTNWAIYIPEEIRVEVAKGAFVKYGGKPTAFPVALKAGAAIGVLFDEQLACSRATRDVLSLASGNPLPDGYTTNLPSCAKKPKG